MSPTSPAGGSPTLSQALASLRRLSPERRAALLDLLARRYRERLDQALAEQVRRRLGAETAVSLPRHLRLHGPLSSLRVPPAAPLLDLFDERRGRLLVLGAAGAGKTTLALELALALVARAQADPQAPLPVLLSASAWLPRGRLSAWLGPALREALGLERSEAASLAEDGGLLLLLDDLDGLPAEPRAAFVRALNVFMAEQPLAPLVVLCRERGEAGAGLTLAIDAALELEPLDPSAVARALAEQPAAQGALAALQREALLREVVATPLMLNLLLAQAGQAPAPSRAGTAEERRRELWAGYLRGALAQPALEDPADALRWLRWLARRLRGQGAESFVADNPRKLLQYPARLRFGYRALVLLLWTLVGGLGALLWGASLPLLWGLLLGLVMVWEDTQNDEGGWLIPLLTMAALVGYERGLPAVPYVLTGGLCLVLNGLLRRYGLRLALAWTDASRCGREPSWRPWLRAGCWSATARSAASATRCCATSAPTSATPRSTI